MIYKRNINKVICVLCGFFIVFIGNAQQNIQNDTLKVLFVGNSFTSFYNVPQVVSGMANANGIPMLVRKSTKGGSNLEQHWKAQKGTKTHEVLEQEDWDYVVFNNHSRSAFETPERFLNYGKKFAKKVKRLGAKPVFMVTWAYKSDPSMQQKITDAYDQLADKSKADLVYVGEYFKKARTLYPDLELFHDNKHQSQIGAYLIALAFYKYFFTTSVMNVTTAPSIQDINGEDIQLIFIKKKHSDILKGIVEDFKK